MLSDSIDYYQYDQCRGGDGESAGGRPGTAPSLPLTLDVAIKTNVDIFKMRPYIS